MQEYAEKTNYEILMIAIDAFNSQVCVVCFRRVLPGGTQSPTKSTMECVELD
jgi:hypothetical protein